MGWGEFGAKNPGTCDRVRVKEGGAQVASSCHSGWDSHWSFTYREMEAGFEGREGSSPTGSNCMRVELKREVAVTWGHWLL